MRRLPHLNFKWHGQHWSRPRGDFDAALLMCVLEEMRELRAWGEELRAGIDCLSTKCDELRERLDDGD